MTRLEQHKQSLIDEKRFGPLLRVDELGPDELDVLNRSFLELCRSLGVSDINETYRAYVGTLHQWGVMCPHPLPLRLYDGWRRSDSPLSFDESRWYDCGLCSAAVVNR